MKPIIEFLARYRRLYGLLILIPVLWFAVPTGLSLSIGIPLMVCGILFRIWSSGYIHKDNRLAQEGPYSIVRNPLYFGSYLMGAGAVTAGGNWIMLGIYLVTYPVVYISLTLTEEWKLVNLFPEEYPEYLKRVPRLIPRPWKYRKTDSKWQLSLAFKKHREYAPSVSMAVLLVFYVLRMQNII
jgi:protein-S-isoprenylcysteine O-methyltransferase Ste14